MSVAAVVPVKDLRGTKSRLTPILDPAGRAGLTLYMMCRVVSALREAGVEDVCVISPDRLVLQKAREEGASALRQQSRGLNPALEEGRRWAVRRGATALLVLPADLPLLDAGDVRAVISGGEEPSVVISPDAARVGTNALLLRPPGAIHFAFGPGSFHKHQRAAEESGIPMVICERPHLSFDLDTKEDLANLKNAGTAAAVKGLEILPVRHIPEVRPGDDLAGLLAESAEDKLISGDVLVVTHKIVSKAENRLVDLRTVEPSAFAKRLAIEHGKDPRQTEVVLRESRRIVRMDRGVIISETHHGFVCANAGVDASNVPADETVCLLPIDPDASAEKLRESLTERTGAEIAVVISDSFGRPWRHGITDVAVGVAGLNPLADYRGQRDPHGYPLEASILAVADELAAAAELVMGKTAAIPAAIIRNYAYEPGPGTARDLLMGPERDLFR